MRRCAAQLRSEDGMFTEEGGADGGGEARWPIIPN